MRFTVEDQKQTRSVYRVQSVVTREIFRRSVLFARPEVVFIRQNITRSRLLLRESGGSYMLHRHYGHAKDATACTLTD